MPTTRGQKMIKAMEAAMKLSNITPQERTQQEIKCRLIHKLHHILHTEWDPIGVHALSEYDCSDEYRFYLPTIVDMVMEGASIAALSNQLMVFESYILGDANNRRRCDVIAVMVSHFGPYAAKNTFVPVIDTSTSDAAHQSVCSLVTKTRLDAYRGRWSDVRDEYEKVVAICQEHLSDRNELHCACLNNLGMAYSKVGELEKALQTFK
jgi:hypothetical protein